MGRKYAFHDLKPKKGRFLYHVAGSTILLFAVVFLYTWADFGKVMTLSQSLRLLGIVFLIVLVLWAGAYLLHALIRRGEKSSGD